MDFLTALLRKRSDCCAISCNQNHLSNFSAVEAEALAVFTNLSEFKLTRAGLTDVSHFPLLLNLQTLDLSHNALTGGFEALILLPELSSLNLSHNKIEDLEQLKALGSAPKLEALWTFNNPVMEIPQEVLRCELFMAIETLSNLNDLDEAGDEVDNGAEVSDYSGDEKPRKRARSRSPRGK